MYIYYTYIYNTTNKVTNVTNLDIKKVLDELRKLKEGLSKLKSDVVITDNGNDLLRIQSTFLNSHFLWINALFYATALRKKLIHFKLPPMFFEWMFLRPVKKIKRLIIKEI